MNPADLFAGKAAEYAKHRVDYPEAVIGAAFERVGLDRADVVADLGSGTGLLSRWLLERGNAVFGVEPDPGMRGVAEAAFARFGARFTSVEGTAERTSLPDARVTLVTAGNAFHYFDPRAARDEVRRILRPGGRVLLIGHGVTATPNAFMRAYLDLIAAAAPSGAARFHERDRLPRSLEAFFGADGFHTEEVGDVAFPLTSDGLRGRFLSTSVAPPEGDARRSEIVARVADLFQRFERDGTVWFQLRWTFIWSERGRQR